MSFGGRPGGEIIRVSGTAFALEVVLGRGWQRCGGGEVYLGLYDIVFPVVRHNIDMPRFKNKKRGEVCGWISVLFIIQCLLINHAVLMSGSFSTNEPLIEYLYEERI